jgi:hypothetical protein
LNRWSSTCQRFAIAALKEIAMSVERGAQMLANLTVTAVIVFMAWAILH